MLDKCQKAGAVPDPNIWTHFQGINVMKSKVLAIPNDYFKMYINMQILSKNDEVNRVSNS